MRVLLFTGKGGVGKTTAAAATAVHAARAGRKTLVISTDGAHSLADALSVSLTGEPIEIEPGLFAQQVDAQASFERAWREVQRYLVDLLSSQGVDPLEAEELTVLPGAEEVLALLAVRDQVVSGRFDLIVLDCAPTAETLRLLALPEALRWYLDRIWPMERRIAKAMRPLLSRASSLPMPGEIVFDAIERLHGELAAVHDVLTDPAVTSVRLILTPEAVVLAEARRTLTVLSLYGYRVDEVLANRIFPSGGDGWREGWVAAQTARLIEAEQSFTPLRVRRAPYTASEPVGLAALAGWADQVYGDEDPAPASTSVAGGGVEVERTVDGFALTLPLPLAGKGEVDLSRRGDDLAVTVGGHRRLISLPSVLRRCVVQDAALRDGRLVVRFLPDPAVWMKA